MGKKKKGKGRAFCYIALPNILFILAVISAIVVWGDSIVAIFERTGANQVEGSGGCNGEGFLIIFALLFYGGVIFALGPIWIGIFHMFSAPAVGLFLFTLATLFVPQIGISPILPLSGCLFCAALFWSCRCGFHYGKFEEDDTYICGSHLEISIDSDGKGRITEVDDYGGSSHLYKNCWMWIGRMFLLMVCGLIIYINRNYINRINGL